MLRNIIGIAALCSGLVAAPAMAVNTPTPTLTYNFSGNSAVSGTAGNTQTFTATAGTQTVKVKASAWTISTDYSGFSISKAFLGAYSGGLGVTSSSDANGAYNLHTVDNHDTIDFIALQFDQDVIAKSAVFSPFDLGGYTDNDATIAYGSTSTPFSSTVDLSNESYALSLFKNAESLDNNGTSNLVSFNSGGTSGNLLLVMAKIDNCDWYDAFKLKQLNVTTVPTPSVTPAVPEPASWAMMIAGFGLVGGTMRRRTARPVLA